MSTSTPLASPPRSTLTPPTATTAHRANGWPVGDWGLIVIRQAAQSDSGDYLVVFGGRCRSITAVGVPTLSPAAYDPGADVTRCVIRFDNALKCQNFLVCFSGVASPCRFAKVIRPGYTEADEAAKGFSDEFLAMLRALRPGVIRGMDFLRTNHSRLAHWADRPTQASPTYSAGGPVEDLIDICNAVGSDLWLNVPHEADAGFRSRLAALVAGRLRPDLSLYVEYSNEIWNTQFRQSQQNQDAVLRDRAAGVPFDLVPSVAGWQRTARSPCWATCSAAPLSPPGGRRHRCGRSSAGRAPRRKRSRLA